MRLAMPGLEAAGPGRDLLARDIELPADSGVLAVREYHRELPFREIAADGVDPVPIPALAQVWQLESLDPDRPFHLLVCTHQVPGRALWFQQFCDRIRSGLHIHIR